MWAWPSRVFRSEGSALTFTWQMGALLVFAAALRSFSWCSLAPPPPPPPPMLHAMDTCILIAAVTNLMIIQRVLKSQSMMRRPPLPPRMPVAMVTMERIHEWDVKFESTRCVWANQPIKEMQTTFLQCVRLSDTTVPQQEPRGGAQGGGGDDEERPNKEEETETRERDAEMNAGRRTGRPSVLWTVPLSRRGERGSPSPACHYSELVGCTLAERAFNKERERGSARAVTVQRALW